MSNGDFDRFRDDILVAFVDGELDAATREQVAQAAARDPEIRQRVDMFRRTGELSRGAFSSVLEEPVPQRLLDTVHRTGGGTTPVASAGARWAPLAMAASLVAVSFFSLGTLVSPFEEPAQRDGGPLALEDPLFQRALERSADGVTVAGARHAYAVTPRFTFRTADGDYCREFDLSPRDAGRGFRGIACRQRGTWRTAMLLARAPAGIAAPARDAYVPASGEGGDPVGDAIARMIDGEPLRPAEVQRAVEQEWKQ